MSTTNPYTFHVKQADMSSGEKATLGVAAGSLALGAGVGAHQVLKTPNQRLAEQFATGSGFQPPPTVTPTPVTRTVGAPSGPPPTPVAKTPTPTPVPGVSTFGSTAGKLPPTLPPTLSTSFGKPSGGRRLPGGAGALLAALGIGTVAGAGTTAATGYMAANRAENNWNNSNWWAKLKSILSMLFGNETMGSTAGKYMWSKQASAGQPLEVTADNPYKF